MLKQKLIDILKEPLRTVIAVDLDGTLCEGEFWGDGEPEPKNIVINKVNNLYKSGAVVLIYTARMPEYARQTQTWLDKHGVLYHGVNYQRKPGADVYIDDKALNVEDF